MSSSCLSEATIVRCEALSEIENGVIFVPVVVQVVFLIGLVVVYWGSGRKKHLLILAEGWAFYTVTLLDLLSHVLPEPRSRLQVFKTFDVVIGILSFVPILLYTIFLYILARSYFLPLLSRLTHNITKYALLAAIIITIAMNELGSFFGISYRVLQDSVGNSFLAIGFDASDNQTASLFFTSMTLVLLIIFQALVFCFCFYLAVSIFQERRTGHSMFDGRIMPTLKGVAWISVGVKLGTIETILGFVDGGFPVVLARRLLRMLSRGCLALGVLQSDSASTSRSSPPRARTMTEIRAMISNPRTSTFARLSPTATDFYTLRRPAADDFSGQPIPRPQRVTVLNDGSSAPSLTLRLSDLRVPPAEVLTETFNRRGTIMPSSTPSRTSSSGRASQGNGDEASRKSTARSMSRSLSAVAPQAGPSLDPRVLPRELQKVARSRNPSAYEGIGTPPSPRPNPKFSFARSRTRSQDVYSGSEDAREGQRTEAAQDSFIRGHSRMLSGSSLASDSLSIVHALAAQFPGIPPRRTASGRRYSYREQKRGSTVLDGVVEDAEKPESVITPSNSIKRKPAPSVVGDVEGNSDLMDSGASGAAPSQSSSSGRSKLSESSSFRRKGMSVPPPIDSMIAGPNTSLAAQLQISSESTETTPSSLSSDKKVRSAPDQRYGFGNRSEKRPRTASNATRTPGLTLASGTSPTDTDLFTAREAENDGTIDPFRNSDGEDDTEPRYRISELAAAESGLGRMASRVAQLDRQRRPSLRGEVRPSPVTYSPSDRERWKSRDIKGKGKERARLPSGPQSRSRPPSAGPPISISSPRRLSGISSRSASSLHTTQESGVSSVFARMRAFSGASTLSDSSVVSNERELMRVKNVGRVSMRQTPTPSSGSFAARQSMRVDSVDYSVSDYADRSASSQRARWASYRDSGGSGAVVRPGSSLGRDAWTAEYGDEYVIDGREQIERAAGARGNKDG